MPNFMISPQSAHYIDLFHRLKGRGNVLEAACSSQTKRQERKKSTKKEKATKLDRINNKERVKRFRLRIKLQSNPEQQPASSYGDTYSHRSSESRALQRVQKCLPTTPANLGCTYRETRASLYPKNKKYILSLRNISDSKPSASKRLMINDSVIDAVSNSLSSAKTNKNSVQKKTAKQISREVASTLVRNARRGEAAKILKKMNIRREALRA